MGKNHGIWFFASTVVAAVFAALRYVADRDYSVVRSNLGSWAEGLSVDARAAMPASAGVWMAIVTVVALGATVVAIFHLVALLRERQLRSPIVRIGNGKVLTQEKWLTRGTWTLHFNPKHGYSKTVTFLDDGSVGEGRNKNEWRCTLDGDKMAIWREDGSLQNRFEHVGSPDEFVFIPDSEAKGIKNQSIERDI